MTSKPFTVEDVLGTRKPEPPPPPAHPLRPLGWAVLGGLGLGFLSNLAGACPMRQHVLAGQGDHTAWWYLLGFYLAAPVFTYWLLPILPLR